MSDEAKVVECFTAIVQAVREQNTDGSFHLSPQSSLTTEEVLLLLLEGNATIFLHLRNYFAARNNFEVVQQLETFYHSRELLSSASKTSIMDHKF